MSDLVDATSDDGQVPAVKGVNTAAGGFGVLGESMSGRGVVAKSDTDYALRAASRTMPGIRSSSELGNAVEGWAKGAAAGVIGLSEGPGSGLTGKSDEGTGVIGVSLTGRGVHGHSKTNAGVVGESDEHDGVWGTTHHPERAAMTGVHHGGLAGFFDGRVHVTEDLTVVGDVQLAGADLAEDFAVGAGVPLDATVPGTVLAVDDDGRVRPSSSAYDPRALGIVSGLGDLRPAVVLNRPVDGAVDRSAPVALTGRVSCKVDASYGSIEVGCLLTTSPTPGHAMRAVDQQQAFGAVIGKALGACRSGTGVVTVLVGRG